MNNSRFRIWIPFEKKYIYEEQMIYDKHYIYCLNKESLIDFAVKRELIDENIYLKERCLNIKDELGNYIFERDILYSREPNPFATFFLKVDLNNKSFMNELLNGFSMFYIAGNENENPDLLKKSD